ncbi:uncharacterized protein LOC129906191 [Episyrphus balteatus]|uniref:uncharacterized protein LOC129906191 n=1 Tax=Episyrphus balteatus TaxID=286459 RepID=UPI0024866DED|nr:uncharacterized protein LOC129906191 [Episyrphus balteatus]
MGCINSKEELREIQSNSITRSSNVYRVNACRISADAETIQNGYLELSPKELAFLPEMGETIKWALQHLRRYGCTGDVFSFEAGRRCMTGPGIYTFRMHNAENMHRLFQSYINSVARSNDTVPLACTDFPTSLDLSSSHSQDPYLEPSSATSSLLQNRANLYRQDSAQSSPLSSNLNSPSSFQGANFTNEVIHLNAQPNRFTNPNSNLYQEFPIKPNEFNNNIPNKNKSQDVPPQELAPNIQTAVVDGIDSLQHPRKYLPINDDEQHMYENVNEIEKSVVGAAASSLEERCYENFSSINLPILINESTNKTPTNENSAVVNYITLDLVQSPTSTDSFSLKVKTNAATTAAAAAAAAEASSTNVFNNKKKDSNNEIVNAIKGQDFRGNNSLFPRVVTELSGNNADGVVNESTSTSMGYSTIDFIKTCALIKSAPACDADCQESRITRHSTCVLKNSSLSE